MAAAVASRAPGPLLLSQIPSAPWGAVLSYTDQAPVTPLPTSLYTPPPPAVTITPGAAGGLTASGGAPLPPVIQHQPAVPFSAIPQSSWQPPVQSVRSQQAMVTAAAVYEWTRRNIGATIVAPSKLISSSPAVTTIPSGASSMSPPVSASGEIILPPPSVMTPPPPSAMYVPSGYHTPDQVHAATFTAANRPVAVAPASGSASLVRTRGNVLGPVPEHAKTEILRPTKAPVAPPLVRQFNNFVLRSFMEFKSTAPFVLPPTCNLRIAAILDAHKEAFHPSLPIMSALVNDLYLDNANYAIINAQLSSILGGANISSLRHLRAIVVLKYLCANGPWSYVISTKHQFGVTDAILERWRVVRGVTPSPAVIDDTHAQVDDLRVLLNNGAEHTHRRDCTMSRLSQQVDDKSLTWFDWRVSPFVSATLNDEMKKKAGDNHAAIARMGWDKPELVKAITNTSTTFHRLAPPIGVKVLDTSYASGVALYSCETSLDAGSIVTPFGHQQWAIIGVHIATGMAWRYALSHRPFKSVIHPQLASCVLIEATTPATPLLPPPVAAAAPREAVVAANGAAVLSASFTSCRTPYLAVDHHDFHAIIVYDIVKQQQIAMLEYGKLTDKPTANGNDHRVWLQWMNAAKLAIISTGGQVWHWEIAKSKAKPIHAATGVFALPHTHSGIVYHQYHNYHVTEQDSKDGQQGIRSVVGAVIMPHSRTNEPPKLPTSCITDSPPAAAAADGETKRMDGDGKRGGLPSSPSSLASPPPPAVGATSTLPTDADTIRYSVMSQSKRSNDIGGTGMVWCGPLADGQSVMIQLGVENDGKKLASISLPRIDVTYNNGRIVSARVYLPIGDNVFAMLVDRSVDILYVMSRWGSLTIFRLPTLERVYTDSLTWLWSFADVAGMPSSTSISSSLPSSGVPNHWNRAVSAHLLFDPPSYAMDIPASIPVAHVSTPRGSPPASAAAARARASPPPPAAAVASPTTNPASSPMGSLERIALPRGIAVVDDDGTIWCVRFAVDVQKSSKEATRSMTDKDGQWVTIAKSSNKIYSLTKTPAYARTLITAMLRANNDNDLRRFIVQDHSNKVRWPMYWDLIPAKVYKDAVVAFEVRIREERIDELAFILTECSFEEMHHMMTKKQFKISADEKGPGGIAFQLFMHKYQGDPSADTFLAQAALQRDEALPLVTLYLKKWMALGSTIVLEGPSSPLSSLLTYMMVRHRKGKGRFPPVCKRIMDEYFEQYPLPAGALRPSFYDFLAGMFAQCTQAYFAHYLKGHYLTPLGKLILDGFLKPPLPIEATLSYNNEYFAKITPSASLTAIGGGDANAMSRSHRAQMAYLFLDVLYTWATREGQRLKIDRTNSEAKGTPFRADLSLDEPVMFYLEHILISVHNQDKELFVKGLLPIGGHFIHQPDPVTPLLIPGSESKQPSLAFVITWLHALFGMLPGLPITSRWNVTRHMHDMILPALKQVASLPAHQIQQRQQIYANITQWCNAMATDLPRVLIFEPLLRDGNQKPLALLDAPLYTWLLKLSAFRAAEPSSTLRPPSGAVGAATLRVGGGASIVLPVVTSLQRWIDDLKGAPPEVNFIDIVNICCVLRLLELAYACFDEALHRTKVEYKDEMKRADYALRVINNTKQQYKHTAFSVLLAMYMVRDQGKWHELWLFALSPSNPGRLDLVQQLLRLYSEAPYWTSPDVIMCIKVTYGQIERLIRERPHPDWYDLMYQIAKQMDRVMDTSLNPTTATDPELQRLAMMIDLHCGPSREPQAIVKYRDWKLMDDDLFKFAGVRSDFELVYMVLKAQNKDKDAIALIHGLQVAGSPVSAAPWFMRARMECGEIEEKERIAAVNASNENEAKKEQLLKEIADHQAQYKVEYKNYVAEQERKAAEEKRKGEEDLKRMNDERERQKKFGAMKLETPDEKGFTPADTAWDAPLVPPVVSDVKVAQFQWKPVVTASVTTFWRSAKGFHEHTTGGRRVRVKKHPFAAGSIRSAYFFQDVTDEKHPINMVGKQMTFLPQNTKEAIMNDVISQLCAKYFADEFMRTVNPSRNIDVVRPCIYEFDNPDDLMHPAQTLWFCEPMFLTEVDGFKDAYGFRKWNNNGGGIQHYSRTLLAFAHWSWKFSNAKIMLCDLQGMAYMLTDPQIHSAERALLPDDISETHPEQMPFGVGDFGLKGYDMFFKTHACSDICRQAGLAEHKTHAPASDDEKGKTLRVAPGGHYDDQWGICDGCSAIFPRLTRAHLQARYKGKPIVCKNCSVKSVKCGGVCGNDVQYVVSNIIHVPNRCQEARCWDINEQAPIKRLCISEWT